MPDTVQDATFEILKRIQESIAELRSGTEASIDALRRDMTERFDQFSAQAHKDRRNVNGLMALLQAASGDFDERIRDMDERVSILEDRAG